MISVKYITVLLASLLLFSQNSLAAGYWKGFSIGGNTANGACKTQADWDADFKAITGWQQGFNAVRLFASSDCGTLANAVPAANKYKIKILVGVWATDGTHFGNEKAALLNAIQRFGTGWIAGISVGSEDLYRGDISPQALAGQIYDVRGMVRQFDSKIQVGHTDTWTAWVNGANDDVTRACDFVIMDGYPYWQGAGIWAAKQTFYDSLTATRNHVSAVKPGIWVWVGETGWSTLGAKYGQAIPNKTNALRYWKEVACSIFNEAHTFWFTAFDNAVATPKVEQGFGVAWSNRQLKWDLTCSK